jgi:hypothetical protein
MSRLLDAGIRGAETFHGHRDTTQTSHGALSGGQPPLRGEKRPWSLARRRRIRIIRVLCGGRENPERRDTRSGVYSCAGGFRVWETVLPGDFVFAPPAVARSAANGNLRLFLRGSGASGRTRAPDTAGNHWRLCSLRCAPRAQPWIEAKAMGDRCAMDRRSATPQGPATRREMALARVVTLPPMPWIIRCDRALCQRPPRDLAPAGALPVASQRHSSSAIVAGMRLLRGCGLRSSSKF